MIRFFILFIFLFATSYALETNTSKVTQLSEDPLFHAARKDGFSLHDAINRAIENSPKLYASHELVLQEKMKTEEAFAGHLPVVNISGDTGYELRDTRFPEAKASTTNSQNYKKIDLYFTITQNLYNGGAIENSVDSKEASLKASLYDFRDKLEKLVVESATAYFELVYSEIALKISKKNMQNYEKILNIVDIKERNGAATKGDVNFIKANVENAKTEYIQKEKALSDAVAKYTYLLQTKDDECLPFEIETPIYSTDLNSSLNDADSFNAQLLRQKSYITATRYDFLASQGNFHPKVDLAINTESRHDYDKGQGKRERANALLTFSYNLYKGGKDEAAAVRLLSTMKEQRYLYQDIHRNLVFDIKVLNQSVSSLSQSLALTQKEVLAAREVVDSYWISFQHGTQDLQALQLAQRNLNRAEQDYAAYKKSLLIDNFELMRKTGVLLKFLEVEFKNDPEYFKEDREILHNYYNLEY